MPGARAGAGRPDIGEPQAAPLRQLAAARASELPRQHDFFAASVGADDMRAKFARAKVVAADDLLFTEDGMAKEGVGGAGHRAVRLREAMVLAIVPMIRVRLMHAGICQRLNVRSVVGELRMARRNRTDQYACAVSEAVWLDPTRIGLVAYPFACRSAG